jgi:hypothetical protein
VIFIHILSAYFTEVCDEDIRLICHVIQKLQP